MSNESDSAYLRRRALEEAVLAEASSVPSVQAVHLELAARYAAKVNGRPSK